MMFLQTLRAVTYCPRIVIMGLLMGGWTAAQDGSLPSPNSASLNAEWARLTSVLEDCSPTYHDPWDETACRTLHQGAYLGNGDLGVHLGGTRHSLVYYLGKNGFHAGNNLAGAEGDGKWTQHILNLAVLTIVKSNGVDAGDSYKVTQDLKNSQIQTACSRSGAPVASRAYLSPTSNISMNYNGQNPYYGVFAANHVDLVDPYIESVKFYSENTGRKRVVNRWVSPTIAKHMPAMCRGVAFELSFTSHGTSCGQGAWIDEDGSMPTNAVFGILPIVWKWKYGKDTDFLAQTCYPLMREVADFFDDYIGAPENGKYAVYGAVHEGRNWFAKNDMFSLGAIRFLYREIIDASIVLDRDADRRLHWRDILSNMSEYPLQEWGNTITFRPDSEHDVMDALTYQGGPRNTGLMFTTTFDNISQSSLPAYRIATCNTLDKGNMFSPQRFSGWQDSNDFGMMFVMAVRSGYDADRVIDAIKGWRPGPNGIVSQKRGGGIETAGIVEAINNMVLQSHDGVIRIFPNWDRTRDAEFKRLRAVGAFLVDAQYRAADSAVNSVRIFSEKGHRCVVQSPFEGAGIIVTREDNQDSIATVRDEDEYAFATAPGVAYHIRKGELVSHPAGAPTITTHPEHTNVVAPASARFSVSATGENLRFQWQKNRMDIPGATAAQYTTPATTLWDIGSRYRCVISNEVGTVISEPGIVNPYSD